MTMRRPSVPPRPSLSFLVLAAALFCLALGGCYTNDSTEPRRDSPVAPVLTVEPLFSAGFQNTIEWSLAEEEQGGFGDWSFLVQRSTDPLFAAGVQESGWIQDLSYEFLDLEHGSTYHFRVMGRNPKGTDTEWSANQFSTQDAVPPANTVLTELKDEQTSLLFTFEAAADDQDSGVNEIELWFGPAGEDPTLYGVFPPGLISVQATQGGIHELTPYAIDAAGNRQDPGTITVFPTLVPEPIILTDRRGEDWDITAAVLEFRMAEEYWGHGIGRHSIRPIIDPFMIGPEDPLYPDPENLVEILAVNYNDDRRAYKMGDLPNREVVNDVVGGIPIAACY